MITTTHTTCQSTNSIAATPTRQAPALPRWGGKQKRWQPGPVQKETLRAPSHAQVMRAIQRPQKEEDFDTLVEDRVSPTLNIETLIALTGLSRSTLQRSLQSLGYEGDAGELEFSERELEKLSDIIMPPQEEGNLVLEAYESTFSHRAFPRR